MYLYSRSEVELNRSSSSSSTKSAQMPLELEPIRLSEIGQGLVKWLKAVFSRYRFGK